MSEKDSKATDPITEGFNDNPFSEMLTRFNPKKFVGREDIFGRIIQAVSSGRLASFSVYGARKIGKTTLLKYLCKKDEIQAKYAPHFMQYSLAKNSISFVYIDIRQDQTKQEIKPSALVALGTALANSEAFRQTVGAWEPLKNLKSLGQAKDALRSVLEKAGEKRRLVLCLDHFDWLAQNLTLDEGSFFATLTKHACFILAMGMAFEELEETSLAFSCLSGRMDAIKLELFSPGEAQSLMRLSEKGDGPLFSPEETGFLLEVSGQHPFLLTVACDFFIRYRAHFPEVRDHISDRTVQSQVKLDLEYRPAVRELFRYMWEQLDVDEQLALFNIASDRVSDNFESQKPVLGSLRQKSLIYGDFKSRTYKVFSDLFRDYVLHEWGSHLRGDADATQLGLTGVDKKVFNYLKSRPNEEIPTDELYKEVWRKDPPSKRAVEAVIHRLRGKFQDLPNRNWEIENVRKVGYRYVLKSVEKSSTG
jgi:DNA-binding winged helix-turn-helix (wHTH) protein